MTYTSVEMDKATKMVARHELKAMVAEASQALARLDAARLEELALSCAAFNRDLSPANAMDRRVLAREAREAGGEMAILARVLEATRANIHVMNRLRALRMGQLEYDEMFTGELAVPAWSTEKSGAGSGHGDN